MDGTPASFSRKFLSLIYESLLLSAWILGLAAMGTAWGAHGIYLCAWLILGISSYFLYPWYLGGQTLAMKTWHLKLVSKHPSQYIIRLLWLWLFFAVIPLAQYAFLRNSGLGLHYKLILAGLWILWPLLYAYVDHERQYLHDRLAGTRMYEYR